MRSLLSQFQTPTAPRKSQSVFSGLVAHPVTLLSRSPSLLRIGNVLFSPTLSAIDGCHPKQLLHGCHAPFQCRVSAANALGLRMQAIGLLTVSERVAEVFPVFHRSIHSGDLCGPEQRRCSPCTLRSRSHPLDAARRPCGSAVSASQRMHWCPAFLVHVSLRRIPLLRRLRCSATDIVNHAVLVLGDINWVECPPSPMCRIVIHMDQIVQHTWMVRTAGVDLLEELGCLRLAFKTLRTLEAFGDVASHCFPGAPYCRGGVRQGIGDRTATRLLGSLVLFDDSSYCMAASNSSRGTVAKPVA